MDTREVAYLSCGVDSLDSNSSKKKILIAMTALMYAGYLVYRYATEEQGACFMATQISPFTFTDRR